jgi:hypothetical protein
MRTLFLILLSLMIHGCTYHWQSKDPITPVTYKDSPYRAADSVGKLRRLALMPVEIKSYAAKYAYEKEQEAAQEAAALSYEDACARLLSEKKGYEIVVVMDADGKWQSSLFENSGYNNIQDLYQKWHKETAEKHTTSVIQNIGRALNVDGVLVIRIKERKPWGVTEGTLNIALVNIPLFYSIASPDLGAWIYETATGRRVWREEHSIGNEAGVGTTTVTVSLISLFADLENAVPHQLIK